MAVQSEASVSAVPILLLPQACKVTGLTRSMIYQLECQCQFPTRVRLGLHAVGWVESELQLWLASRIERHRARRVLFGLRPEEKIHALHPPVQQCATN